MQTVLLWNRRWWLGDSPEPLPFNNLSEAAGVLGAQLGQTPRRIRLIYQPETLAMVATPCPKGSRGTLAAALSAGFPALGSAKHAWSHEPILGRGDGFATLLYFEREPGLEALLAQLAGQGLAIESVWPLPAFLSALPPEWSESGAVTVVAVGPDCVCGFRHGADGERCAPAWSGDTALAEFAAWLGELLGRNPDEPVLLVGDPPAASALESHVALDGKKNVQWLTFRETLTRRVVLPRLHPAQLLAPAPIVTGQRAVIAASLVFFALAAWSGASYARNVLAWRTAGADREIKKQALRAEVDHLRANAAQIARLRDALAGVAGRPPAAALLQKISATIPPQIACDSLSVSPEGFALAGHLAPSAPAGILGSWRARLADPAWTLDPQLIPAHDGAFTLAGMFPR